MLFQNHTKKILQFLRNSTLFSAHPNSMSKTNAIFFKARHSAGDLPNNRHYPRLKIRDFHALRINFKVGYREGQNPKVYNNKT